MKLYTAKTVEDALKEACEKEEVSVEELMYEVKEEKKGLFSKKAVIEVYEMADVIEYAENYIKSILGSIGMDISLKTFFRDNLIKILIETDHNSLLIGKNGQTLQALNELTKLAISSKFKRKFRILLDIGDYKDKKYSRVISISKRSAKEVLRTHIDVKLDPMTPDERKKVHNALSTWKNIKTESVGDGKDRAIVIKYVGNNIPTTNIQIEEKEENKEGE